MQHNAALDLSTLTLRGGAHATRDRGLCTMEAVAWLAGESHSDHPACACPVLAAFARELNDSRWPSNAARTEALRDLVPLLVGSRGTAADERARRKFLARWALTVAAPLALMAAVCRLEDAGHDATALRAAALRLCEEPTSPNAHEAARQARQSAAADAAYAAAYASASAAAAAAAAAYAYADAYADAAAAAYAADAAAAAAAAAYAAAYASASAAAAYAYAAARVAVLRLAADALREACAIRAEKEG